MPYFRFCQKEPLNQIGDNYVLNRGQMLTEVKCSKVCFPIKVLVWNTTKLLKWLRYLNECFRLTWLVPLQRAQSCLVVFLFLFLFLFYFFCFVFCFVLFCFLFLFLFLFLFVFCFVLFCFVLFCFVFVFVFVFLFWFCFYYSTLECSDNIWQVVGQSTC